MKVNAKTSQYQEVVGNPGQYTRQESRLLAVLLRRLRFLEIKVQQAKTEQGGSTNVVFAEMELDALEFALTELNFIDVSGNERGSLMEQEVAQGWWCITCNTFEDDEYAYDMNGDDCQGCGCPGEQHVRATVQGDVPEELEK